MEQLTRECAHRPNLNSLKSRLNKFWEISPTGNSPFCPEESLPRQSCRTTHATTRLYRREANKEVAMPQTLAAPRITNEVNDFHADGDDDHDNDDDDDDDVKYMHADCTRKPI
ncbi:hypothetical protein ElyMa_004730400 [Elysia marginata]|uniref:Uncharacterized protein n=1 Tax=Elysia marginata TaxID=1093978 RepID=A0AAV4IAX2_9GAST|nr:hypothetical protein ElyMa_004730400 [Elysia marginata]